MKPRVALACLLMVLFTAGCDPPPEEEPEAMTAVEWVAKEPENARARLALGRVWMHDGKVGAAITEFEQAIRLDATLTGAYLSLGAALQRKERPEEAAEAFRNALRLEPELAFARSGLGVALANSGDMEGARDELQLAVELDPSSTFALMNLGRAHEALGDPHAAIDAYQQALREDRNHVWARNNLAWLYATSSDETARNPEQALVHAKRAALITRRRNPQILDTLAEAHYVNGELDRAVWVEERAIAIDPEEGFLYEQLAKFEAARQSGALPSVPSEAP